MSEHIIAGIQLLEQTDKCVGTCRHFHTHCHSTFKREKASPFFVFFYVDQDVICARGRGGGIAVWARTSLAWELQSGVV